MTDTLHEHADPELHKGESLVEMVNVGKTYGAIRALKGINLTVKAGEVTCVLGDNGAGKSTLIKIISGLHPHNEGELLVDGKPVSFSSPRESLAHGIATVYQDLAVVSLMEVWRNFFLGSEMTNGTYPLAGLKIRDMKRIADEELRKMGIVVKDIDQPIGTLSGGQRQCVAIARAVYFGARVLILDEPTAALGVKQSGVVLKYTAAARDAGLGVVFITHNPHHAYLVGDHFIILKLGQAVLDKKRVRGRPGRADPSDGRRRRAHRAVPRAQALQPVTRRRLLPMTVAVAHQVSATSRKALVQAVQEAKFRGTDLAVLHVVESIDADNQEAYRLGVSDEIEKVVGEGPPSRGSSTWSLPEGTSATPCSGWSTPSTPICSSSVPDGARPWARRCWAAWPRRSSSRRTCRCSWSRRPERDPTHPCQDNLVSVRSCILMREDPC